MYRAPPPAMSVWKGYRVNLTQASNREGKTAERRRRRGAGRYGWEDEATRAGSKAGEAEQWSSQRTRSLDKEFASSEAAVRSQVKQ